MKYHYFDDASKYLYVIIVCYDVCKINILISVIIVIYNYSITQDVWGVNPSFVKDKVTVTNKGGRNRDEEE